MDYRELGKKSLKTVLTVDKNVSILEKEVYNIVLKKIEKKTDEDIEKMYKAIIYQIIGDILAKKKLSNILEDIKQSKISS